MTLRPVGVEEGWQDRVGDPVLCVPSSQDASSCPGKTDVGGLGSVARSLIWSAVSSLIFCYSDSVHTGIAISMNPDETILSKRSSETNL